MKMIYMALAAMAVSSFAIPVAEARTNTRDLTCQQAQNLVRSKGGIVLSTGRYTYDRYVSSSAYCPTGDYTLRAYVPTRDRRSCSIGYTCTMDNPWD